MLRFIVRCLFVKREKYNPRLGTPFPFFCDYLFFPAPVFCNSTRSHEQGLILVVWSSKRKFNENPVALTHRENKIRNLNPEIMLNKEMKSGCSGRRNKIGTFAFGNWTAFHHMFGKLVNNFILVSQCCLPSYCAN